jgi:hypothetical protein
MLTAVERRHRLQRNQAKNETNRKDQGVRILPRERPRTCKINKTPKNQPLPKKTKLQKSQPLPKKEIQKSQPLPKKENPKKSSPAEETKTKNPPNKLNLTAIVNCTPSHNRKSNQ